MAKKVDLAWALGLGCSAVIDRRSGDWIGEESWPVFIGVQDGVPEGWDGRLRLLGESAEHHCRVYVRVGPSV